MKFKNQAAEAICHAIKAREDLSAAALRGADVTQLASALNAVAHAQGRAYVYEQLDRMDDVNDESILGWLVMEASAGARDRWSGRRNDAARAFFDGKCEAIQNAPIMVRSRP